MVSMLKSWTLQLWIVSLWWGVLQAQQIQTGDAQGLRNLVKDVFRGLDDTIKTSWAPILDDQNAQPQCSVLSGVTCDADGHVIGLALPGKMTGGLLNNFQSLQYLQNVDLKDNGLKGELSGWSANALVTLLLQNNQLVGLAESSLQTLEGLKYCDLSNNNIEATIPQFLPPNITYFNIAGQQGRGFAGQVTPAYCPLITAGTFIHEGNPSLIIPDTLGCVEGPALAPTATPPLAGVPSAPAPGTLSPPDALSPPAAPGAPLVASSPPPTLIASPPPLLPSPPPPCGVCTVTQVTPPAGSCECISPVFANMTIAMEFAQFPLVKESFFSGVANVCNISVAQVRLLGARPGSVLASLAILPPPPATSFSQAEADRIVAALQGQTLAMAQPLGAVQVSQVTPPVILAPPADETGTKGSSKGGINIGIIVGAVVGALALIALLVVVFCCLCRGNDGGRATKLINEPSLSYEDQILPVKKEKVIHKKSSKLNVEGPIIEKTKKSPMKSALVTNRVFTFKELQVATNYFARENLIGEGALGRVYKAELSNGQVLAVKKLDNMSSEKERDFMTVVNAVGRLRHDNLVELEGYCAEPSQHALAYQYVNNGSLFDHLHAAESGQMLMWNHRVRIALGAARALEYLHEIVSPPVVHRNFKSANVLLDTEYSPKVADSGLAALGGGPGEKVSTQMLGTFGYAAPEYAMTGQHTAKSDVYSFGVVCLELLTGRRPLDSSRPRMEQSLVRWAVPQLQDVDALAKMADPKLLHHYPIKSLARFADIIALCVQPEPEFRPPMSEVVQALVRLQQRNTKVSKSGDQDSGTYFSGAYGTGGDNFV